MSCAPSHQARPPLLWLLLGKPPQRSPVMPDVIARLKQHAPFIAHVHTAGVPGRNEIDDTQELQYRALMKALLDFPALLAGAAESLEPHRVANYLHDLAGKVHLWYHKAHVLNEPEAIMQARLALARASQVVLHNGLTVLGLSAPERM